MHRHASHLLACAFAAVTALSAQDDLRDRITRTDGREVRGRIVDPFAEDQITVLQGGKRVRIPRAEIQATATVADAVRAFCDRRARMKDSLRAQEYLIDEAVKAELPGLARLQAMWVALHDDTNEKAHTFLGHQKTQKGWLWLHEGKRMSREQLDVALQKQPLELVGERFTLRCDAGLQTNVAALLDLEQLGVAWYERFGKDLQLQETLQPVHVVAHRNVDEFPKWGFRPVPYYVPRPHADLARTFYAGPAPVRPEKLFFVGTQGLLYRSMIGEASRQDDRDRVCAWLEIGFGMLMQQTMDGPAGFARPGELRAKDLQALQALGRGYRLTHLLHLPMYGSFYLTDDTATAVNWAAATMFVAWLLEPDKQTKRREAFLQFVRAALLERKGDSSTLFDKTMGQRVEDLDEPWRAWLAKTAGY